MSGSFHCFLSKSGRKRRRKLNPLEDDAESSSESENEVPCSPPFDPEDLTLPGPSFQPVEETTSSPPISPDVLEHLDFDGGVQLFNPLSDESDVSSTTSEDAVSFDESIVDNIEPPDLVEPTDPCVRMEKFLTDWAFESNASHKQLSLLCQGLVDNHPECFLKLHRDARTYFKTPRGKLKTRDMGALNSSTPGRYFHISIIKQLITLLPLLPASVTVLKLIFYMDGLPLIKGGTNELWPILMKLILENIICKIMPVSLFYGPSKPADNVEFLDEFMEELKVLCTDGLEFNGTRYEVIVAGFGFDTPAKAFVLGIIYPNAYFSCPRCKIEGEDWQIATVRGQNVKISHKRVFLDTKCSERTDDEFRSRSDEKHRPVDRECPLVAIESLDMVRSIILDYQHLVLLGSMKYFMTLWFGTEPSQFKVSAGAKLRVCKGIRKFHSDVPCEFARQKPRELKVLSYWKATEFRFFLLYLGPILLKGVLDPLKYDHFLMLHLAIRILVSRKHCSDPQQVEYARSLLISFVESAPQIYSETIMVLNLHCHIHLADDIQYFQQFFPGCTLDTLSTFVAEDFMQQMKKLSRAHSKKLEQVGLRIAEAFLSDYMQKKRVVHVTEDVKFKDIHNDGPLSLDCTDPQYRSIIFPSYKISTSRVADSCCILDSGSMEVEIMCIENVASHEQSKKEVVIGRIFKGLRDLYKLGDCNSSSYGIFSASHLSTDLEVRSVTQIMGKYVCFNDNDLDGFFLFPLIHTLG